MRAREARRLGTQIAELVRTGEIDDAYGLLAPVLAERTQFAKLGLIADETGKEGSHYLGEFLDRIASRETEGGWVVIGTALGHQLRRDMQGALQRCRRYIIAADVWYGADILGERVPGPALLADFNTAVVLLAPWRDDDNVWVRRALGVAAHFWAKRSQGRAELAPQAVTLLTFLEPLFDEWEMAAAKGVGWGLKTIGRYYPQILISWLPRQLSRRHRALMVRKATTYLTEDQRSALEIAPTPEGSTQP